jgi:hypothetical protein
MKKILKYCCRLAAFVSVFLLSVDVEAASLKRNVRGSQHHSQWETLNRLPHTSAPVSLRASRAKVAAATPEEERQTPEQVDSEAAIEEEMDDKLLEEEDKERSAASTKPAAKDSGNWGLSGWGTRSGSASTSSKSGEEDSTSDQEKKSNAVKEEEKKKLEEEKKLEKKKADDEEREEREKKSREDRRKKKRSNDKVDHLLSPEDYTTTPPAVPYSYMYDESDAVARDVELRRGADFFPQGTNPEVDVPAKEQFVTDTFFTQDPSIFGNCILIRDYAEPLRVGSALVTQAQHRHHGSHHRIPRWHRSNNNSSAALRSPPQHVVHFANNGRGGSHQLKKEEELPNDLLLLKGGVIDRDVGEEDKPGKANLEDDAELEVSMFAFLRTIAGEVAVIPNGDVAKWSSKKKVPIAGYLCTSDHGPVLHTLPTPCLPTTLDENGQAFDPPDGDRDGRVENEPKAPPPQAPPMGLQPAAATSSATAVPAQSSSTDDATESNPDESVNLVSEADAASTANADIPDPLMPAADADPTNKANIPDPVVSAADAAPTSKADAPTVKPVSTGDDNLESDAEKEAEEAEALASGPTSLLELGRKRRGIGAPAPATASGATHNNMHYHVWVGSTLLHFSSKPKAERFCKRLTKRIADDLGDEDWDADRLMPDTVDKQDMSVANFMAISRKQSPAWTKGTKSVLVVVMDWMYGDESKAPYSRQTLTPGHYEDRIFPRVRQAFQRMSYNKFDISVTVVPEVIPFAKPRSRYTAGGYPFPGLYNGAKESLEGNFKWGDHYQFNSYDLVFVISPQQAPTGTKGVAWVGAKGAMCNGCEAISENFQVMVAVHELGHNLGLWHASSKSLEYGNVFDWMGNYPDVTGLSYGLGYKLKLHWLPEASVAKITDSNLHSLNAEYHIRAFDGSSGPSSGQFAGIQIDLRQNRRLLYVSYRETPGAGKAGVFLTMQDRDKPNSELVDCACHSPSQQDAALREGWTYLDPTSQVVVHARRIQGNVAVVHIYKAPGSRGIKSLRSRRGFTDGQYTCPSVCTDSDLLVSSYNGCSGLARDGYCSGGSITMGGKKFSIGSDLCPVSCDQCKEATSGGTFANTCTDKNVKISGMSCTEAAAGGYCDYSTNIGHIGDDLCPRSCDRCPAQYIATSATQVVTEFADPTPTQTFGDAADSKAMESESQEERDNEAAEKETVEETEASAKEQEEEAKAEAASPNPAKTTCTDDAVWTDHDGDGCAVYAEFIKQGKLSKDEACNYGTDDAKIYCRHTCGTCSAEAIEETCEDKMCVTRWQHQRGKCFSCDEWKSHCDEDFFAHDCPRTCGMCKADGPDTTPPLPVTIMPPTTTLAPTMPPTEPPTAKPAECEDEKCVVGWLEKYGECHKCRDFAEDYCGHDEVFMQSCRRSCHMCFDGEAKCHDDFLPHTCKRYAEWGWCSTPHVFEHCKASCGLCAVELKQVPTTTTPLPGSATRQASSSLVCGLFVIVLSFTAWRAPSDS